MNRESIPQELRDLITTISFQQDIQQLKYVVFGIAIFALIALYVSFRILRNFKQFLRK